MISAQLSLNRRAASSWRLHLYVAHGCPFCHRILGALALTGLQARVSLTWMRDIKHEDGWGISPGDDPFIDATRLESIYQKLGITGQRRSVPLLIELSTGQLLSADSAEITRFVSRGMDGRYDTRRQLLPHDLDPEIDRLNRWLHSRVNRAVYRVGFARSQGEYEDLVGKLFQALDLLEARVTEQPFLFGDTMTESDLYLLPTLTRFDSVYHTLFKCSYRRIADYPALSGYMHRLMSNEALQGIYDHRRVKSHYYQSIMHVDGEALDLNPTQIIPVDSFSAVFQADSVNHAV